ncbi:MAG: hypothetical protein HY913_02050 [Desulfomonile tiedjei]|nr:hypothetical protein [Desulfomonile tiedjei]
MADIRSTIDLMMERTRGMTLSPDERESLRTEDLRKRAKGFKIKLLQNPAAVEEILSSLDEHSPEDRTALELFIWEEMVDSLPLDHELLQYLELMEKLPQAKLKGQVLNEIRSRFKTLLKDQADDRHKSFAREKKKLAALGISGSAVVPKIPKQSPLHEGFSSDFAKLKRDLLA